MENKIQKKTKIDIILPNYNSSKFIFQTINSILKQTYKSWKLIIVDDFSDTKTKNILCMRLICVVHLVVCLHPTPNILHPTCFVLFLKTTRSKAHGHVIPNHKEILSFKFLHTFSFVLKYLLILTTTNL